MNATNTIKAEPAVLLTVGGGTWAIPVRAVERALHAVEISPCPGGPAILLGAMNVAGTTVPVFDLSRGGGSGEISPDDKILLVRTRGERLAGLWANDVSSVVQPASAALAGPPATFQDPAEILTEAEEEQVAVILRRP